MTVWDGVKLGIGLILAYFIFKILLFVLVILFMV
jgi:hypothetical protein